MKWTISLFALLSHGAKHAKYVFFEESKDNASVDVQAPNTIISQFTKVIESTEAFDWLKISVVVPESVANDTILLLNSEPVMTLSAQQLGDQNWIGVVHNVSGNITLELKTGPVGGFTSYSGTTTYKLMGKKRTSPSKYYDNIVAVNKDEPGQHIYPLAQHNLGSSWKVAEILVYAPGFNFISNTNPTVMLLVNDKPATDISMYYRRNVPDSTGSHSAIGCVLYRAPVGATDINVALLVNSEYGLNIRNIMAPTHVWIDYHDEDTVWAYETISIPPIFTQTSMTLLEYSFPITKTLSVMNLDIQIPQVFLYDATLTIFVDGVAVKVVSKMNGKNTNRPEIGPDYIGYSIRYNDYFRDRAPGPMNIKIAIEVRYESDGKATVGTSDGHFISIYAISYE